MALIATLLQYGTLAAVAAWALLSAYVLAVQRWRATAQATMAAVMTVLGQDEVRSLSVSRRLDRVRGLLQHASRELVMQAAAATATPPEAAATLTAYLEERWGSATLERDAAAHRTSREKWRRWAALQIIFRSKHPRRVELATHALQDGDADIAMGALSLLGGSDHPDAIEILVDALKQRRLPASRIAVYLDRSPGDLSTRFELLLADPDPIVRRWAATLLGRYAGNEALEDALAHAANDADAQVRKAAIQTLGQIGDELAAATALRKLSDPVAFVRAAAARAIGSLQRDDLAAEVAVLLGDPDWFVRFAARQTLEKLGSEIWPVLIHLLEHPDQFVRNGAAEVFQNLGALDDFILMEAATDDPAPHKVELLSRVASAGGIRLTDSLLERAGPKLRDRVRQLLSSAGFQHVGAA